MLKKAKTFFKLVRTISLVNTIKYVYHRKVDNNWNFITKSKFGFKFKPFTKRGFLYYLGYAEPKTVEWLNTNIGFYDVFINIGAGYGEYSLIALSKRVDTIIFEPHPELYKYIKENIDLNNYKNYNLFPYAVGEREGKSKLILVNGMTSSYLRDYGRTALNAVREINVEVKPLRKFKHIYAKYSKPLFLIDTEGNELEVVKGIPKETIEKSDFIIETSKTNTLTFEKIIGGENLTLDIFGDFANFLWIKARPKTGGLAQNP